MTDISETCLICLNLQENIIPCTIDNHFVHEYNMKIFDNIFINVQNENISRYMLQLLYS